MKAISETRLAALQLRLEDEERRYEKAEARLQEITGDDGALPPIFNSDFQALRKQVKSDLASIRLIGRKIKGSETSNHRLLRHFRQSSKANEQHNLMAETLESCHIRLDSLETTLERWSRDQELAELITQLRSLSKTQANNAVTAQKHISGLHEKLDQLKQNEKPQDYPSTNNKPQDKQPSHPATLQTRETIARLHYYCVAWLIEIHKALQGDELLELYTRLVTWGFGLLAGSCALDAVPLVGSMPQQNSQHQRVSAWFVEITTNLFIILVHLEVVLRLLKLDDKSSDQLLHGVPVILESTAHHLKSSEINPTMMRSFRVLSKSDPQDIASALVADHLLAVDAHVTSLFKLNPVIEAVRDRHCYYSSMPWLTKATREPRQKKTDWHEMLESQITKVMALLIETGVFDRTTSTRTLAIFVAEQFEEELARLEQWKVKRHDDFENDDILEPEVSALIGTLELWLRKMDLKTIKDAKGRREWTSAEAGEMLEEIRPTLDNISRFLNAQAPPNRPESVASDISAEPPHSRYSSAREDVVHTFRPLPRIRSTKVDGIEEELPDQEQKPRQDSISTTTTDSEHRRTAIWDMLRARRLPTATPNTQPENAG